MSVAPGLGGRHGHTRRLDGIRGLAILLVLWHHNTVLAPSCGFVAYWKWLSGFGVAGVDLFFVLSGF